MKKIHVLLVLALAPLACGGGGGTAPPTLDPDVQPDVVILSISGHEGALNAVLCTSEDNYSYLGEPGEAVDAVIQAFVDVGMSVQYQHFSDRLAAPDANGDGVPDNPDRLGFVEFLDTMENVYRWWIEGQADPTQLVIVAHSHGTNWAHIATSIKDYIPVSYLVTLDGICLLWECEHQQAVADWVAANSLQYSWDISRPCDVWNIPGQPLPMNTKDVVFPSVAINLEVQSTDLVTSDCCDNYRLDGSLTGISTFITPEGHNELRPSSSVAMTWVADQIRATAVP